MCEKGKYEKSAYRIKGRDDGGLRNVVLAYLRTLKEDMKNGRTHSHLQFP